MQPLRVEPESASGVRARNISAGQPSNGGSEKKRGTKVRQDADERRETVCTVVANELDPRTIIQWPRLFAKSVLRILQVFATVRHIRVGDVIGGLVNTALLFTFAAVFSSGMSSKL